MELGLSQAYYGVYCSSKEILKSNQRLLYCNMLKLLVKTIKTTGITGNTVSVDENINFWLSDILPLVFDEDETIQKSAIDAIEIVLHSLDVETIHKCYSWASIKVTIVENYTKKIHKFRDDLNSNWYKTWCILIRILDKEILKGASTINAFLSIVELGFRSTEYNVRSEAFLCWKLLIEIFAKYNEICSPKRIKLISIPLKSSQSKTQQTAIVKLKVWWYLICKINTKIECHFDMVIEPFLTFCFGSPNRNGLNISRIYQPVKEKTILCLSAMLIERNLLVEKNLQKFEMEVLPESPIINNSIVRNYWKPITYSVFEIVKLYKEYTENEESLMRLLLKNIIEYALQLNHELMFEYIFQETEKVPDEYFNPAIVFFEIFSFNKFVFDGAKQDMHIYGRILLLFTKFFIAQNTGTPTEIVQKAIINMFDITSFKKSEQSEWLALVTAFNVIFENEENEDFNSFETKVLIWNSISQNAYEYMRINNLEYRLKEKSEIFNRWIMWPLKVYSNFQGKKCVSCFVETFCTTWRNLIDCGHNSNERHIFLKNIAELLSEIIRANKEFPNLSILFDCYVQACFKAENSENIKQMINLLQLMLTKPSSTNFLEPFLSTFKKTMANLTHSDIKTHIDDIKNVISLCVKLFSQKHIQKAFFDEFKRSIIDKMKTYPNKTFLDQIKEIFKSNDVFVIIPSVWSLNPDKLTERQKEKFHERGNIPALYNDMSQSQESKSLKPWTPKKVVITKFEEQPNEIATKSSEENIKSVESQHVKENKIETPTIINQVISSSVDDSLLRQKEIVENIQKPEEDIKKTKRDELTNFDRELLKKWNIDTQDGRKVKSILKQLRLIEIDTVDGGKYRLGEKARKKRPIYTDEGCNNSKQIKENLSISIKPPNDTSTNENKSPANLSPPLSESVFKKRARKIIIKSKPSSTIEKEESTTSKGIHESEEKRTLNSVPQNLTPMEPQQNCSIENNQVTADTLPNEVNNQPEISPFENEKVSAMDISLTADPGSTQNILENIAISTESCEDKKKKLSEQETEVVASEDVLTSNEFDFIATDLKGDQLLEIKSNKNEEKLLQKDEKNETENVCSASLTIVELPQEESVFINSFNSMKSTPEICPSKQISPKKSNVKITPLSSPPDRKPINNSTSPTLRPKPSSTHLTGRGAQLINMIRNKKLETSAQKLSTNENTLHFEKTDNKVGPPSEKSENVAPLDTVIMPLTENTSTPISQNKDFLVFSKRLPSPTASPSASILKRKIRRDSLDDISDSPAFKRKRVSFLDPPVSITKEYVTDNDGMKSKPKRCLVLERANGKSNSAKNTLKRKLQILITSDIEKLSNDLETKTTTENNSAQSSLLDSTLDDSMSSLKWKSFNTTNESDTSKVEPFLEKSNASLVFDSKAAVLNYIANECSIDEVFEKYSSINQNSGGNIKIAQSLAKYLLNCMTQSPKIKTHILETLSEKLSKDFLDHAVQENLSSVVCDRLNLNSVIDYVCAKSKINTVCRNSLLQQIPHILSHNKLESERINFITETINSTHLTDEQIFYIIELLITKKRTHNEESISESAIDSSSNL